MCTTKKTRYSALNRKKNDSNNPTFCARKITLFVIIVNTALVFGLELRGGAFGDQRRRPLGQEPVLEQLPKCGPKHLVHAAVQDEVNRTVEERQDVHELAHVLVTLQEEALALHPDQQAEDSLRELRY